MCQKKMTDSGKSWHSIEGVHSIGLGGDPLVLEKYGDMIQTDWRGVRRHPHADYGIRAAQFAPFAALSDYDEELAEIVRPVEQRADLTESALQELDQKLREILGNSGQGEIEIEYFAPDLYKDGGSYQKHRGYLKRLDLDARTICMKDGLRIPVDEIRRVEIL